MPALGALPPPSAITSVSLLPNPHTVTNTGNNACQTMASWSSLSVPLTSAGSSSLIAPTLPLQPLLQPVCSPPQAMGMVLSPALEPFPARLVARVRSGQYVELRDFLTDNISLLQQLEVVQGSFPVTGPARPRLREITSLPSWLYCFLAYVAIHTNDHATRDQLAYARLLIRESQRHGGGGWLDYDRVFRQQVAIDSALQWNTLHAGLQASTILGQRSSSGIFCTLCRESDHTPDQCALSYLYPHPTQNTPLALGGVNDQQRSKRQPNQRRRPESLLNICVSWNKGQCIYPGTCNYRHVCATCHLLHKAKDCPDTPEGSEYKPFRPTQRPWRAVAPPLPLTQ